MEAIACRSPAWGSNYIERRLVVGNVVDQFTAFGPPIDVPVSNIGICRYLLFIKTLHGWRLGGSRKSRALLGIYRLRYLNVEGGGGVEGDGDGGMAESVLGGSGAGSLARCRREARRWTCPVSLTSTPRRPRLRDATRILVHSAKMSH